VTAGTYGSSTQVSQITVDAKGRITSASNVGINFSAATVAQANAIRTVTSTATTPHFLTFVDTNNTAAGYESLYTDGGISYVPSTNSLTVSGNLTANGNLTADGTTTLNGNVTLGNDALLDTVTITSRVNSNIIPSGTTGTRDLGSSALQWRNVYATSFIGAVTGNAASATKLLNARNFQISGDVR
jgi:hypothetical protein